MDDRRFDRFPHPDTCGTAEGLLGPRDTLEGRTVFIAARRALRRHVVIFIVFLWLLALTSPAAVAQEAGLDGSTATMTSGETVLLRATPGFDAAGLAEVTPGAQVQVLGGPMAAADGSMWYQVDGGYLPAYALSVGSVPAATTDPTTEAPAPTANAVSMDGIEIVSSPVWETPAVDPSLGVLTDPGLDATVGDVSALPPEIQSDAPLPSESMTRTGRGGRQSGGQAIADFAAQFNGYPYVYAGANPSTGFDCSGFTMYVIQQTLGIDITHDMFVQYGMGAPVDRGSLQPGDLVFFQNTFRPGMSHNGVYLGNNQMVHAENESTGVKISDITSDYYASRWYGAVRFG